MGALRVLDGRPQLFREFVGCSEGKVSVPELRKFLWADWLPIRHDVQCESVLAEGLIHAKHEQWGMGRYNELYFGEHPDQSRKDFVLVDGMKMQVNFVN